MMNICFLFAMYLIISYNKASGARALFNVLMLFYCIFGRRVIERPTTTTRDTEKQLSRHYYVYLYTYIFVYKRYNNMKGNNFLTLHNTWMWLTSVYFSYIHFFCCLPMFFFPLCPRARSCSHLSSSGRHTVPDNTIPSIS